MTLGQQWMYLKDLDDPKGSSSDTIHFDNLDEALAYRAERKAVLNG